MKHVAGFANSAGTRITAVALARLQSRRSGVVATEQMRTRAVNMDSLHSGSDTAAAGHLSQTRLRLFVIRVTIRCDFVLLEQTACHSPAYEPGGQASSGL